MRSKKYLIEDHWWLLKIFASKSPIWTLIFVVPLCLFWGSSINNDLNFFQVVVGMICGVVTWSLLEYAIHRFIFHWLSEQKLFNYSIGSFHLYHHEIPSDRRVYTSGLVPALFWSAFTFSSMTILSVNSNIVLVTLITGTLFYFFYEWVHFYVHVREFHFAPIRYLQMLHLHHHLRDGKNFGQTLPLWDVIFRTYETPDEKRVLKELSELLMSGNER